jgi:hypothetical protein
LLAVAAAVLGYFIYSGIRSRVTAASHLKQMTEEAAVTDVVVVHPKENPPLEEVVLPGARRLTSILPFTPGPMAT